MEIAVFSTFSTDFSTEPGEVALLFPPTFPQYIHKMGLQSV